MPEPGHFILRSNFLPQLTAGKYELVTDQVGLPFDVAAEHTHVVVSAPRYTMPVDQVISTFPPANAEGAFGARLPQVVLKRRTLPWERNPAGSAEPSPTPWLALVVVAEGEAELSTAAPVAECVTPGTALLDPADRDVEQGLYLAVTETVVRKIFPTEDDLALLTHVREVDVNDTELAGSDDDGWLAVVLANRLPVADEANGGAPVRYMACLVNVEGQLGALPEPSPAVESFAWELAQDWSVLATARAAGGPDQRVMGGMELQGAILPNTIGTPAVRDVRDAAPSAAAGTGARAADLRLAATSYGGASVGQTLDGAKAMRTQAVADQWSAATRATASAALDRDAKRLVRDTMAGGFRLPIELFAAEKVLRFPVLAHWSFTTRGTLTFESLMQGLDVGILGTVAPPEPPPTDEEDPDGGTGEAPGRDDEPSAAAPADGRRLPEVVATGHIGLGHRTRRGDATRAWYRGPLVPFPVMRDPLAEDGGPSPVAHSADQLRRVIPDGREDLSLAAAFEIGRLLGLSQLSVVSALLRFRGEQFGAARVRELVSAVSRFELPPLDGLRLDLGRFVALRFVDDLARDRERMIGPRRPVADPGRELEVRGELDRVVADGLGIDLDVVRKLAEEVGVAAAIARVPVPVAHPRGYRLDERGLAAMRGALGATLAGVVDVAAPPPVVIRDVRRGARAGAPSAAPPPAGPDPLDLLIERAATLDVDEEE